MHRAKIPNDQLDTLSPGRYHKDNFEKKLPHGFIKGEQGSYDVHRIIGKGGTSIVKEIINRETGKKRALKIIYITNDAVKESYEREYRILLRLGRIDPVRIKTMSKKGVIKRQIVMDYANGVELFYLMDQRKLPYDDPAKLLRLGLDILLDLYKFHQAGILLIDDKVENIMVDPETLEVLHVDFGSAEDNYDFEKNPGIRMEPRGTYANSAPEVLNAMANNNCQKVIFNQATDIYTVGAALRQLLMGEKFDIVDYVTFEVGIQKYSRPYLNPFAHPVHAKIQQMLIKTTSNKPEQRPLSLEEIIEPFEEALRLDIGSSIAKLPQLTLVAYTPPSDKDPKESAETLTMHPQKLTDTQLQTAVHDYIKEKNRFFGIRWCCPMSEATLKIIMDLKNKKANLSEEQQYQKAEAFISKNPHTTFAKKLATAMNDPTLTKIIRDHDAKPWWRRCFG